MSNLLVYHMSRYLSYQPKYDSLIRLDQIACSPPLSYLKYLINYEFANLYSNRHVKKTELISEGFYVSVTSSDSPNSLISHLKIKTY